MKLRTAINRLITSRKAKKEDKDKIFAQVFEEHKLDFVKDKEPRRYPNDA